MAILVPYIDLLVAMTGSLGGAFLCFTLPAIIHVVSLTWDEDKIDDVKVTGTSETGNKQNATQSESSWPRLGKGPALMVDVLLIVVGAIACTVGTYATVSSIIREKLKA